MAVTALSGMEVQLASQDEITMTGSAAYSTTQHRTGAVSVRFNPGSGGSGSLKPTLLGSDTAASFSHFGLYIASLPSIDRNIFGGTPGTGFITVRLTSSGTLTVYDNTTLMGTSAALSTATWHWIGVRRLTGTSVAFLQIDGTDAVTGTATVTSSTVTIIGPALTEATAIDVYIDDVILDDAGFLGPSKVALLVPISDNARGANWFKADGTTTTNLFQSVDNIPPAGVASASEAATPLASIRHTGGANNAYDANLTTYTTAGVNSGDTVIAIKTMCRHGEDIATGTKVLAQGLVSNPAPGVGANFNAGADAGAHGAEPGIWRDDWSTVQTSPSVTLGSSPVLRMSRPETASRVACVDFMGAYMAWTPAVAAAASVPYVNIYPPLLAQ